MAKNTDPKPPIAKVEKDARIGLIVSRFNSRITDRLRKGAIEALKSAGTADAQIEMVEVPGAFEIPLAAKKMAEAKRAHALIAIGCVLRGETDHYNYVCSEVSRGLQLAQLDTGVPCIFCVLTCDTEQQALDRSGGAHGNKGHEAGIAAVEMASFIRKVTKPAASSASKGGASAEKKAGRTRRK
jgi:6,7-dimethyl-8-ribityllumazine synthase